MHTIFKRVHRQLERLIVIRLVYRFVQLSNGFHGGIMRRFVCGVTRATGRQYKENKTNYEFLSRKSGMVGIIEEVLISPVPRCPLKLSIPFSRDTLPERRLAHLSASLITPNSHRSDSPEKCFACSACRLLIIFAYLMIVLSL